MSDVYRFGRNKEFRFDSNNDLLFNGLENLGISSQPMQLNLLKILVKGRAFQKRVVAKQLYGDSQKTSVDALRHLLRDLCVKTLGGKGENEFFEREKFGIRWHPTHAPEPEPLEFPETPGILFDQAAPVPGPGRFYYILARGTNLAVDVKLASIEDGAKVHLWNVPGWNNNQLWELSLPVDGYFMLRAKHSRKCLDAKDEEKSDGTRLIQYEWHGGANQQWRIEPTKDHFLKLIARHSGQCLDRDEHGFGCGAKLQMWKENNWPNQEWDFVRQDHLLVGQHFLVDSRLGDDKDSDSLSQLLNLLVEITRRRASFSCWLAGGLVEENPTVQRLCLEFPAVFRPLYGNVTPDQALAIGSIANADAPVITALHDVEDLSGMMPASPIYAVRTSEDFKGLRIPELDLSVSRGGDPVRLAELLSTRLKPLWQEWAARVRWEDVDAGQPLPEKAMNGGCDTGGTDLYVARAFYKGGWHPGKIVNGMCHFPYGDSELISRKFQVALVPNKGEWTSPNEGSARGLIGGHEAHNPLIVCRAEHRAEVDGPSLGVHPGKVVNTTCEISFGGVVRRYDKYEVFNLD